MSRHIIKIKKICEDEYDIDMTGILSSMQKGFIMPSQNIFNNASLQSIMQMTSGIRSKYYQNTSPKSKLGGQPKYKSYPKNENNEKIITAIDINNLYEVIFTHKIIHMNKDGFDFFNKNLDTLSLPDDLMLNFEVIDQRTKNSSDVVYSLSTKKFLTNDENYYFKTNTPSVISYSERSDIMSTDICASYRSETVLMVEHYEQLNIIVNRLYNPAPSKIMPATIVYDMENHPLEVHCYYKNEYIPESIMNELKPNLLSEDFKAEGYFTKRDMEFLDMLMI